MVHPDLTPRIDPPAEPDQAPRGAFAQRGPHRIGIINEGKLIAVGTLDELRRAAGSHVDADLEAIFLKLTGGEEIAEILTALRA